MLPYLNTTLFDRFWSYVSRGADDTCWEWQGCRSGATGYGVFNVGGRNRKAHQIAWELDRFRLLPTGYLIRHTCDNRPCVNPRHLRIGDHADNTRDKVERGRMNLRPISGDAHHFRRRPESRLLISGERNGTHTRPEAYERTRGELHIFNRDPSKRPTGDRNGTRTHPETRPRGERVNTAKLIANDVRAIRVRLANGERQVDIARAFGVNQPIISAIKRRAVWKHIP